MQLVCHVHVCRCCEYACASTFLPAGPYNPGEQGDPKHPNAPVGAGSGAGSATVLHVYCDTISDQCHIGPSRPPFLPLPASLESILDFFAVAAVADCPQYVSTP